MLGIGAAVGVGLVILDAALGAMKKLRIPPLAVGIGIYLPMSATFAVIIGAILAHWYDGRGRTMPNPDRAQRLGTLVASGLIVGESIWGVINAGLIVAFAPRIGAFVVAGWLFGIVINLLTKNAPEYYDIALRDFGLMLAALTLGRLALAVVPARKSGALPAKPW